MNQRQTPPPFYGIYNDNDNNNSQRLNSDDVEALTRATLSLMEALKTDYQDRIAILEKQKDTIIAACKKKAAEIDAVAENELRVITQDHLSGKSTVFDALPLRNAIHKKADDATALDLVNVELDLAARLTAERGRLWTILNNEFTRIVDDLRVVLVTHGYERVALLLLDAET